MTITQKEQEKTLPVLEFYSGIGGFHFALLSSSRAKERNSCVVQAFDINTNAIQVYEQNFPHAPPVNRKDIESLTTAQIDQFEAELWLLSPPCQPYTRTGKRKDTEDPRAQSFLHLIELLPQLKFPPKYLILENVKGFEISETHRRFIHQLQSMNYHFEEFFLSPNQFAIPNSRLRYFCLARRSPFKRLSSMRNESSQSSQHQSIHKNNENQIVPETGSVNTRSKEEQQCFLDYIPYSPYFDEKGAPRFTPKPLFHFLEPEKNDNAVSKDLWEQYKIPDSILLKSGMLFDIVTPDSTNSCCFTKAYGRYVEGTGSVLQTADKNLKAEESDASSLLRLKLRYFSPREIANLHGFPPSFDFPPFLSIKQRFSLLGNSLNVVVASELINYLLLE